MAAGKKSNNSVIYILVGLVVVGLVAWGVMSFLGGGGNGGPAITPGGPSAPAQHKPGAPRQPAKCQGAFTCNMGDRGHCTTQKLDTYNKDSTAPLSGLTDTTTTSSATIRTGANPGRWEAEKGDCSFIESQTNLVTAFDAYSAGCNGLRSDCNRAGAFVFAYDHTTNNSWNGTFTNLTMP